jgi:hypothetical protein
MADKNNQIRSVRVQMAVADSGRVLLKLQVIKEPRTKAAFPAAFERAHASFKGATAAARLRMTIAVKKIECTSDKLAKVCGCILCFNVGCVSAHSPGMPMHVTRYCTSVESQQATCIHSTHDFPITHDIPITLLSLFLQVVKPTARKALRTDDAVTLSDMTTHLKPMNSSAASHDSVDAPTTEAAAAKPTIALVHTLSKMGKSLQRTGGAVAFAPTKASAAHPSSRVETDCSTAALSVVACGDEASSAADAVVIVTSSAPFPAPKMGNPVVLEMRARATRVLFSAFAPCLLGVA